MTGHSKFISTNPPIVDNEQNNKSSEESEDEVQDALGMDNRVQKGYDDKEPSKIIQEHNTAYEIILRDKT